MHDQQPPNNRFPVWRWGVPLALAPAYRVQAINGDSTLSSTRWARWGSDEWPGEDLIMVALRIYQPGVARWAPAWGHFPRDQA